MANPTSLTNLKKKKRVRNLEVGSVLCRELRWRCCCCFCVTYVRVSASDVIDRRPLFPQLPRTSPWRLQHFSSTINWLISHLVHHYLITHAQLSDLIKVFEVADSLAKFSKEVEFGEFDLLTLGGKDLSPCCWKRGRERENTGLVSWFSFEGHWLTERSNERSGEYSAQLLVILECINREHRRCRAFITFVIKDRLLVLQLTTLSRLAMELHPQPALTTRPQGRTMAEIQRWWCSRFKGWEVLGGCTQISSIRICRRKSTGINRMNIGPKWELWELRLLLLWVYHPYYWSAILLLMDKKVHGPKSHSLVSRSLVFCSFETLTNCRRRASFN